MRNYESLLHDIENGAKFAIYFPNKTMKVDCKYILSETTAQIELPAVLGTEEFLAKLDDLYERYKHSRPSERSESRSRNYFRALPEDELSDEDMLYGANRETCRFELEALCLFQILGGWQWDEERMGKWFYQSKQDKDLVMLRQWFNN